MNASQVNRLLPETPAKPSRSRRGTVGEESLFAMVLQQSLAPAAAMDSDTATVAAERSKPSVKAASTMKETARCETNAAGTATTADEIAADEIAADALEAACVDEKPGSNKAGGPLGKTESFEMSAQDAAASALPSGLSGLANRNVQATGQMPNADDPLQLAAGRAAAGLAKEGLDDAASGKAPGQASAELPIMNLPATGMDSVGSGNVSFLAGSASGDGAEKTGSAMQGQASAILSTRANLFIKQGSEQGVDQAAAQAASISMPAGSQNSETGFSTENESAFTGQDGNSQAGQSRAARSGMPAGRETAFDLDMQALSANRLAEPDRTAALQADSAFHVARHGSEDPAAALDVNRLVAAWNLTTGNAGQTLTVRLTPDVFGAMSIRLEQTSEGLAARIQTDSQKAHALLAAQRGQLEELLMAKGFDCHSIEIVWREAADRSLIPGIQAASRADASIPEQAQDLSAAYGQGQAFSQGQPQADRQAGQQGAWDQPVPPDSARARQQGHLAHPQAGASRGWHSGRLDRLA